MRRIEQAETIDQPAFVAGAAGGLIGSWVMNGFQVALVAMQEVVKTPAEKQRAEREKASAGDDTTQIVADIVSRQATGEGLSQEEKQTAGPIVHYLFGTAMGAVYGGLAEIAPVAGLGFGMVFGSALFLGADEVTLPLLGLSKPPTEQPVLPQLDHWTAHLVYGATVELVRRGLWRLI